MELPEWRTDPEDPTKLRWWDGYKWDPQPGPHPDITIGTPAPNGVKWTWHGPKAWPAAPQEWYPPPGWVPPASWDQPEFDDIFWDTKGEPEGIWSEDSPEILEYDSIRDRERDREAWGEINQRKVPLVWTAPPNWPPAPPGWSPPASWQRPHDWPMAPPGWEFWQPDPATLRERALIIDDDITQRSIKATSTTVGLSLLLEGCDSQLFEAHRELLILTSPLPTAARLNLFLPSDHPATLEIRQAFDYLLHASDSLRYQLLRIAYGADQPDPRVGALRKAHALAERRFIKATARYERAERDLLDNFLESALEDARRGGRRMSMRRSRSLSTFDVYSLGIDFEVDREIRQSRLRPPTTPSTESTTRPIIEQGKPWVRAEELAARTLRSLGFLDAHTSTSGADGGYDVEARGVIGQVKYLGTPVSRPDLQRLQGVNLHGARTVFFSRAGYTEHASSWANQAGMALFTINVDTQEVLPVNSVARRLTPES